MDDQPTCGKGLAENAALPAKLGALTAALAVVLETHMKMEACRKLPMGRHDEKAMTGREPVSAFKTFVAAEQELLAMLEQRLAEDREMLDAMSRARGERR